jgi:hypothetical protein
LLSIDLFEIFGFTQYTLPHQIAKNVEFLLGHLGFVLLELLPFVCRDRLRSEKTCKFFVQFF